VVQAFQTSDPGRRPWTTLEQERDVSTWLGQPGGNHLGLGRHWHFSAALFWMLNGVVYVILLVVSGEWQRLIPTSWSIVPASWAALLTYLGLHQPPPSPGSPYDPLQQLAYAGVVFVLGPFLIVTGAAQSPGIEAQFPRFARLFGGRQGARSLHFLGLLAFVAFIAIHTFMVVVTGFSRNMGDIVLGQHETDQGLAVGLGLALIGAIFAVYALSSLGSRRWPRTTQRGLGKIIGAPMRALALRTRSRQSFPEDSVSPRLLVNGAPPDTAEYRDLMERAFTGWSLAVTGLVEVPLTLTLDDLRSVARQRQITKHHCIQGWSGIAEWSGVPLSAILDRCRPLPGARFLVFRSYGLDSSGEAFYESVDLSLGRHPQSILADEMNGRPLPVAHGAPLRLRVETQLGFKMVKWLRSIELVADYRNLGAGQGGSREDEMYYEQSAGI
jgi:DMSO/TMAO reductase YedYZ molybdopterin-dependent catalytic subunit/thiosulfate reductase cytochrome b subunit